MAKYYFKLGGIAMATFILLAVFYLLEEKDYLVIKDNVTLELILQFFILTILGAIAKIIIGEVQKGKENRIEIANKEKLFYEETAKNYNKAKKVRRLLKTVFHKELEFAEFLGYKNDLEDIQLEFERLIGYLIINEELHKDRDRSRIWKALKNMEKSLRNITEPFEDSDITKYNKFNLKDFPEINEFVTGESKKNQFVKSFDEFQDATYNYEAKKGILKKRSQSLENE